MIRQGDIILWLAIGGATLFGGYLLMREFAPELIPSGAVDDAGDGTLPIDYEISENESQETTAIAPEFEELPAEQAFAAYFN